MNDEIGKETNQETYTVVSSKLPAEHANPQLHVLFAGESQTRPSHRLGPKIYDFYLMHTIIGGRGYFTYNNQTYALKQGDTFLIEPEKLVSYESDANDPWQYRWIAFHGKQAPSLVQSAGFSTGRPVACMPDNRRVQLLYRQIYDALWSGSAPHLQTIGRLYLLLAEYSAILNEPAPHLTRGSSHGEAAELVQRAIQYLSNQYTHPVSISRMSEALGYNRAYLSRLFKRHTGVAPVTFLLALRLDKARLLLRERPELTIEQVAASVGLQDPLHFSKQFRRRFALSPTAYRESMRHMVHDA